MSKGRLRSFGNTLEDILSYNGNDKDNLKPVKRNPLEIIEKISVCQITSGKYQPRKTFDQQKLEALADSIRERGIIQPIILRKIAANKYEIIAGERRWRAAQIASLHQVPAIIYSLTDEEALAIGLIENLQREDLNPIEEGVALKKLIEEFGLTHEQIGKKTGRSRVAITNAIRLLSLVEDVQKELINGKISIGHARALVTLNPEQQIAVAQQIVEDCLSVRETEKLVSKIYNREPLKSTENDKKPAYDPYIEECEFKLCEKLNVLVDIKLNKAGTAGKVVLSFDSLDKLTDIISFVTG